MNYPRKNSIFLKQVYISLSNYIKFENPKSSLALESFIVPLTITLGETKSQIKAHIVNLNEGPTLKRETSL